MDPRKTPKPRTILFQVVLIPAVLASISLAVFCISAFGAVTFDGSTVAKGNTASLPGPNFTIEAGMGTQKGGNLFHSFAAFNIGTGETATFTDTGAEGPIANVLGRVTGGSPSSINGGITSTISGANLFLMNPYGFIFGPNAWINVPGSFHVTTADYLKMADGARFYGDFGRTSTLSTEPVAAFGFLTSAPGPITIHDTYVKTAAGKTLSLVGGAVDITNNSGVWLWAPSGHINLVSLASAGEVDISDFGADSFTGLGEITYRGHSGSIAGFSVEAENSSVDAGGSIVVRGGKLFFQYGGMSARGNPGGSISISGTEVHLDGAYVNSGTRGTTDHSGTGVHVNVTGDMFLTNGSEIASSSYGAGRAGNIRIAARNIQLGDDNPATSLYSNNGFYGAIGSRSFGAGRGGDVSIAADTLTVKNGFFINTAALRFGDAGNITVRAHTLRLLDLGSISSNGLWVGKGGVVDVAAKDLLISGKDRLSVPNLQSLTGLAAQTGYWSEGGLLRVTADNLQLLDSGSIDSQLFSIGHGADIDITAKHILISGMVIDNRYSPPDLRAGIDARVVGSYASGTGGNISIVADNLQVTHWGMITSALYSNAPGNAGNITVRTGSLDVSDRGGLFSSSNFGRGNAGRLDVTAKDIYIRGVNNSPDAFGNDFTGLSTATNAGRGGGLRITAGNLVMVDKASMSAASYGSGHAGNIEVSAGNVEVLNGSGILASAFGAGDGGAIDVKANNVVVSGVNPEPIIDRTGHGNLCSSGIASQTFAGGGNAGDALIAAGSLQVLDGARITTETFGSGNGGSIRISSDNVIVSGVNQVAKEFWSATGSGAELACSSIRTSSGGVHNANDAIGNAGNLLIFAQSVQVQDGGRISSKTETSGTGGNIEFIVDRMNLSTGAMVSAESSGSGHAGNIDITATTTLLLEDSSVATEARHTDGGNVQVNAGYMVRLTDSRITASVGGGPDTVGGNITVDPDYVVLNDSRIIANAYEGHGGSVRIVSDVFLTSPESIVSASSELGIDGTVDIQSPVTDISGTLAPVRGSFLQSADMVRDRCIARLQGTPQSSLTVSGRDGLPPRPGTALPAGLF